MYSGWFKSDTFWAPLNPWKCVFFYRFSEFLVREFLEFSKNVSLVKHSLFLSATVLMFLILYDLLFQIQEKSRRSINKKGRNTLVDLIWRFSEIGRYDLFCLSIDEIFLASQRARQRISENFSTSLLILTIKNFVQLVGGFFLLQGRVLWFF